MSKVQESSTDKDAIYLGSDFSGGMMDKKPNWVNLAHLDGPMDDSLANRLLYKPALRFHGITGGIWGQGLSDAPSITSDPPPSYRFAESMTSRQPGGDACSTCDVDTLYNTVNITAQSPLTLRRRNTVAVILVAIALLAAVAAVTGVILHFLHPKAMLRANVRFTIANRNYTEAMGNKSSIDFHETARPLCQEMDVYFLTSELADFYLGCNVVSMRKDTFRAKNGTEVHYTLDFIENKVSNDAERIKKIIMRKSGRHKTEDTLYLTVRDFLVYLKSLRVSVEVLPLPDDHPGRKHRPRIPWDDALDFIARKSDDANFSSVNKSTETDVEQLTKNLTEYLDRNIVHISVDFPKEILPGAEIKGLPVLKPTPFHPSATLHQEPHALHLSRVYAQLPILSHMFLNISVSTPQDVFNNNSVLNGDGAFINPSKASLYMSNSAQNVINVPTVRELNVKNGVIARKRMPDLYETGEEIMHRHNDINSHIEASFNDINNNFDYNAKPTEILQAQNKYTHKTQLPTEESNPKVFTIFTDVFLIIGSNTVNPDTEMLTFTPSKDNESAFTIPNKLDEFMEDEINVEKRPKHAIMQESFSSTATSKNIAHLKMTTSSATRPTANNKKGLNLDRQSKNDLRLNIDPPEASVLVADNMQLNELIVDLPVQEAVPLTRDVEWINIFNVPQKTIKVHVGNIRNNSGFITDSNKNILTSVRRDKASGNNDPNEVYNRASSVSQIAKIGLGLEDKQQQYFETTENNLHRSQANMDILTKEEQSDRDILKPESNIRQSINTPNTLRKESKKINSIKDTFSINIGLLPPLQKLDVPLKRFRDPNMLTVKDSTGSLYQDSKLLTANPVFDKTSSPLVNHNRHFNRHSSVNAQLGKGVDISSNSFLRNFNINSRRGSIPVRQSLTVSENIGDGTISDRKSLRSGANLGDGIVTKFDKTQQNNNHQPWAFLNKIGVNVSYFDAMNRGSRSFKRNNVILSKHRQLFQTEQRPTVFKGEMENGKTAWSRPQNTNPRSMWTQRNVIGSQVHLSGPVINDRIPFFPDLQMRINWGLPKSPDFNDIADMKEILRQLVESMYNMTAKIDHMQDAINFINKTFHETHRPLFNLEETLGNMTVSLGNLNQNLNSINATMNAFKDFLKQFGNTVFNIDDVIKHIDETIGNLGYAVSFIESSISDLNGTVNGIGENVVDISSTLIHVDRSVLDVNNTATYSNQTLDSMKDTLISLEKAVSGLALKINIITDDADTLDISLKNINDTVKNTHKKLKRLHGKMLNLNSTMTKVEKQIHRLNDTYIKINKTLQNMNEPYMFVNGTVLEVIQKLSSMDEQLTDLHNIMDIVHSNISSMNMSLMESMYRMEDIVQTLTDFNVWFGSNNRTFKISLRNRGMIETLGMLLNMNGTLSNIGHTVDDINGRLDKVDHKLQYLEEQLLNLERTLDNIDVKFKMLDQTLQTINETIKETKLSLNVMNETVQTMDFTFNKVDESFANINNTLESVNKSLEMIQTTGGEINSTVHNVNKTFDGLEDLINKATLSAQKLTNTVSTFSGSVSELNAKLYNANESLRITRNKADIVNESYRMLQKTLTGADQTLSKLRTQLTDTRLALKHANTSLSFVNDSLLGIQESFESLRTELLDVQNSFKNMKTSMQEFDSAFPNIHNSIRLAQKRMLALQLEFKEIDNELHDHKITRDVLVLKHSQLQEYFDSVKDMIDFIQISTDEVKNRSSLILNGVVFLNETVYNATSVYNKTEKNVRYVNKTHDKIKEKYDRLTVYANATNTSLLKVRDGMEFLRNIFKDLEIVIKNYTNIDVNIEVLKSIFDENAVKFESTNRTFQTATKDFKSLDFILWNSNGNPKCLYDEYQALVNKTELVNKNANEYWEKLNETDISLESFSKFNEDMREKLMAIFMIRNKVDEIKEKEENLNNEIANMDQRVNEQHTYLTELLDNLKSKQESLQKLRLSYGDINGTFSSEDSFDILENNIISTIKDLEVVIKSFKNSSAGFRKTANIYMSVNESYQNSSFDLSPKSQHLLNDTLLLMTSTELDIVNIKMQLDAISNSAGDIYNKVNDFDNEINNLENTLLYQKKKNNFVTSKRSKMNDKFMLSFEKYSETISQHSDLLKLLEEVQNKSLLIKGQVDAIPNINISIVKEQSDIAHALKDVNKFEKELSMAKLYLDTFYERFLKYEDSNNTFEDVKKEYSKYNHAVEHFGDAVKNISLFQAAIFKKADNISRTFDFILRQLSDFQSLETPIVNANNTFQILRSKLKKISNVISQATDELRWLKDEFENIKQNYTNFTATDIDLTESYVNEAMDELDDHLLNITTELEQAVLNVEYIQDMVADTEITYNEKTFDRNNIETTIQNIIKPNLKRISDQTEKNTKELDNINSLIRRIQMSINGVNETIHTTNKQLFVDRQKKLLADTKVPILDHSTELANTSLSESLENLNKTKYHLENTMDFIEDLKRRFENHPSINISLNDFGAKLIDYNSILETTFDRLKKNFDLLNTINETIWLEDGKRYLDNETVTDMKKRYKHAEDLLDNIFTDLSDINSIMEAVKNGTNEIYEELFSLNMSMHDLDEVNAKLKDLFQSLSPLNEDVSFILGKVKGLESNLSNIDETFNNLKVRFANINETIFKEHIVSFSDDESIVNNSINNLNKASESVKKDLNILYDLFDMMEQTNNGTYDSKNALNSIINFKKILFRNITSSIDNVNDRLHDINYKVSNTEPNLEQLEIQLVDMENTFSRQEKNEYFENNFYSLNRKAELVKISLSNSSAFLNETKDQVEDTMKETKDLKARLEKYVSVKISLTPLETTLQHRNISIRNISERIRGNFDSLDIANNSLWKYSPDKYSDSESISEMKKRFGSAEKVFDHLFNDSMDIINVSYAINEMTNASIYDIDKLNKSLNAFDETNSVTDQLFAEFSHLNSLFKDLQGDVSKLESNISDIKNNFNKTKSRYKDIKESFFDEYVAQLQANLSGNIANKDVIYQEINNVSNKITQAKHLIQIAYARRNETILSSEALDYVINNNGIVNINVSKLLNEIRQVLSDIQGNISDTRKETASLHVYLDDMEKDFRRQEKEDYFEGHFPKGEYEILNETLFEIIRLNDILLKKERNVSLSLNDFKLIIDDHENIKFDVTPIAKSLSSAAGTVVNNLEYIKTISEDYAKLEILMHADDGLLISDNETISQMKSRYREVSNKIDEMKTTLYAMKNDIIKQNISVEEQFNKIVELQNLHDNYEHLKDNIKELNKQNTNMSMTVSLLKDFYLERKTSLVKEKDSYESLILSFNGTTSDSIFQLKSIINDKIKFLEGNISRFGESVDTLNKSALDAAELTKNYSNEFFSTHVSTEPLRFTLLEFPKVKNTVTNISQFILNNSVSVKRHEDDIETYMKILQSDIERLRKLFTKQEKEDYIRTNAPKLRFVFDRTISDINQTELNIQELKQSSQALEGLYRNANTLSDNDTSLDIPLLSSKNLIKEANKTIPRLEDILDRVQTDISKINVSVFDESGVYFSDSDSLDDIKNTFEKVNRNLEYINGNISLVRNEKEILLKDILTDYIFLGNLSKALQTFKEISLDHMTSKRKLSDLKNIFTNAKATTELLANDIEYLEKRLDDVVKNYGDVKEPSLQHEIKSLYGEIMLLKDNSSALVDLLTSNNESLYKTNGASKYLEDILLNVSRTLEELKTKNVKAGPVSEEIGNDIMFLNRSILNITDEIYADMNFIPKTNKSISDLQERLKRQQIYEYIKENFPTLLQEFDDVNRTLNRIDNRIPDMSVKLETLKENNNDVVNKLGDLMLLKIPFKDTINAYETQNATFSTVVSEKNNLENLFNGFQDVISNNHESNETLVDIKNRFAGYEKTLHDMNSKLKDLHSTLDGMDWEVGNAVNTTKLHISALARYEIVLNSLKDKDKEFNNLENHITNTKRHLDSLQTASASQTMRITELGNRFQTVNSSILHEEKAAIEKNVQNVSDAVFNTQNILKEKINNFEDLQKGNENLRLLLNQNFTSIEQLLITTINASTVLRDLSSNKHILQMEIKNEISRNIPTLNLTIADIEKYIDNLNTRFLEKEKEDFIVSTLPELLKQYKDANKSLIDTMQRLPESHQKKARVKQTIAKLQHRIEDIENINISTVNATTKYEEIRGYISDVGLLLNATSRLFEDLDTSILQRSDWSNFSIEDVTKAFVSFKNNISLINDKLIKANNDTDNIDFSLTKSLEELNDTNFVLDKYEDFINASVATSNSLGNLSHKINKTSNLLENVRMRLYYNNDRLFNLTREFPNVTNSGIEKIAEEIRFILEGKVGIRIPSVNERFANHIIEKYNVVSNKFDDIVSTLNDNYTTKNKLESVFNYVEDTLYNVTNEEQYMVTSEEMYREDGKKLSELLNNSDVLLHKLAEMYRTQMKKDLLSDELPNLKQQWYIQKERLQNFTNELNASANAIDDVQSSANEVSNTLNNIDNVKIPTRNIQDNITNATVMLKNIKQESKNAKEDLNKIPVMDVDIDALGQDETVSVNDIQDKLAFLKHSLQDSEQHIKNITNNSREIADKILSTKDNVLLLNETLSGYKSVEEKLKELNERINDTTTKFKETFSKLNKADAEVDSYKQSLNDLKQKYSSFDYKTNDVEVILSVTDDKLKALNKALSDSKQLINDAESERNNSLVKLYADVDDIILLNETLTVINADVPVTYSKVNTAQKALDSIADSIPDLNIELNDLKEMLELMNETLQNEELKSKFVDNALPVLEKKFNTTKITFEMTNKTLEKMADELDILNNYIKTLKLRMKDFSTINISVSDIDANITYLENRLAIMQDHYNNVKGIVQQFKKDVSVNNIFGRNISLSDVEDQYQSFNSTLDLIDEVMAKIDNEAYEMEEHFGDLNDTMYRIDHALDRFEEKQMNTKKMEKDINLIGNDITGTNVSIKEMQNMVLTFRKTFDDMQIMYADVINSTEDNNTVIDNLLKNMNQSLVDMNNLIVQLDKTYIKNKDGFLALNETLFQPLTTYADLNNTLDDVKNKLLTLSKTTHKLQRDIADAMQGTQEKNSTLFKLSDLLESLNDTLHKEKTKHDFIKSNLGNLENKLSSLKSPSEAANKTILKLTEKLSNTSSFVEGVSEKIKNFTNVHISLESEKSKLSNMTRVVDRIKAEFQDVGGKYTELRNNITGLNNRSGDMNDIVGKYTAINETLDILQDNLTDMLSALDDINFNTDSISHRTENLDISLDKLNKMNTSALLIQNDIVQLEDKLDNTLSTIHETESNTNDLHQTLEEMKRLYSPFDDQNVLEDLINLMKKVNASSKALKDIQSTNIDLINKTKSASGVLDETRARLNSDIDKQETLNDINAASEETLKNIQNKTYDLTTAQNRTEIQLNELQNNIANLARKILQLNETLAEEKRKKDFIADNFPEMEERYNRLNLLINGSRGDITKTSELVATVTDNLTKVEDRLENITAIGIPLDSEKNEVLRLKKEVDNVKRDFRSVSRIYGGLKIQNLNNMSTSFDSLIDTYTNFDKSMSEVENSINNMNKSLDDVNNTIAVINESVRDINSTVDEYIETGQEISEVLKTGESVSANITYTNKTIANLSDEVQRLADSFDKLLSNYSHIKDPEIIQTQDLIKQLLKSSSENIKSLENKLNTLRNDSKNSQVMMKRMNATFMSTKQLLGELKQHINDVKNTSSVINNTLGDMEIKHINLKESTAAITPELKNVFEKISQLTDKYIKEQEKIDLIAINKPIIAERFRNFHKPLDETNKHISLTEVKLADLKYAIKSVGSRLSKFKTLNITTEPESFTWNNMSQTVDNMSTSFKQLREKYEGLQKIVDTVENRNITIDEMKKKFTNINATLDNIEDELTRMNKILTEVETKIKDTDDVLNGLQTTMNNFKEMQNQAVKTEMGIKEMKSKVSNLENRTNDIASTGSDINKLLETMKTTYAVLNNSKWNDLLPKLKKDLMNQVQDLKTMNKTLLSQEERLNSTTDLLDTISHEINHKHLVRENVDQAIASFNNRLNGTNARLSEIEKPLSASDKKLTTLKAASEKTMSQVQMLNTTLHNEMQKYNYVKQNLPALKEKHSNVNTSFTENIPSMESMKGQIANLVSIITKIKEKMRQYGVPDSDNSLKRWDLAIEKLNTTVTTILKKNKVAGEKLVELKSILWSGNATYTNQESLVDLIARFNGYNKTLDEISAASHTINIKLADLDSAASSVISQLMERDSVLTTTPATTTPSGPPEWLSFKSTTSGKIGKDPGFAECSVEDLSEWEMMKITRVNKDGKEEPIAAWKLGQGARKAVRDRRIRVKRTKTATGGKLSVGIQTLQCEDEGTYYCSIDSYSMWPLESSIGVTTPPEDDLKPDFPTEVFQDKVANFSCTGHPGYPNGRITWKIKREKETDFRPFDFYSSKSQISDTSCIRTETNKVEYQFDLQWNNTKVRCYIENTDFYAEGIIRLLPYDICNKVRYLGTISHPYTPHKYIVCGRELNIMQCPGNTCYDETEENCVRCKAGHAGGGDPCLGQPLFSYVAHETDCKKYYICMGPTKTSKKCAKGYFAPNIPGNCVMSYAKSHCGLKAG